MIKQLRATQVQLLQTRADAEHALLDAAVGSPADFERLFEAWAATDAAFTRNDASVRELLIAAMETRVAQRRQAENAAYLAEARLLNAATPSARRNKRA
jgi:hypothetical protein